MSAEKTSAEKFIDAVAQEWPIRSLMGHDFYEFTLDGERIGAVCLEVFDDEEDSVMLDLIKVARDKAGRGFGSMMLDRLCVLADEHFVALEVGVQPDGTQPLGIDALKAMYERRGFEVVEQVSSFHDTEGPRMSRSPMPESRISM